MFSLGECHSLQDASSLRLWEKAEHLLALWTELWDLSLCITFKDNPLSGSAFCLSLCVCDNLVLEKKQQTNKKKNLTHCLVPAEAPTGLGWSGGPVMHKQRRLQGWF